MTFKYWNGTSFVDVVSPKFWNGSAMVNVSTAKYWNGTSFVDFYVAGGGGGPNLSAVISQGYVESLYYASAGSAAKTLTTNNTTVTASGGAGAGPTYLWEQISGSNGITIDSPTAATTSFTATLNKNSTRGGQFRCRVTRGVQTVEVFATVNFEYYVGIPP